MDFALSNEQEMLKRSAREFLATECPFELAKDMATDERGCPPDLWHKMAELGWTALPFPEQYGGAGASIVDLAVLMEEMGRANLPGPYFTSVILGGLAILGAADETQRQSLIPPIASGEAIATLAFLESDQSYDPNAIRTVASPNGAGYRIHGTKSFVPDIHLADYVVCVARTGAATATSKGLSLVMVRAAGGQATGISAAPLSTLAGDKQFEVVFDGTPVAQRDLLGAPGEGWPALQHVLEVAAVAKSAQMLGAAQRVLELCVEHSLNRSQFGRPIGSFQAIQHHCANIVIDVDLSRFLTYQAAWLLGEGQPCSAQVSLAKAFVGDAYLRVVTLGHEVLGGNGLVVEHEMPLFSRRAPAGYELFGNSDYHREQVVRAMEA